MKLLDLDPHWFALESGGPIVGLSFHCPHCPLGKGTRLAVTFHEAGQEAMRDAYIMARAPTTKHIWTKTGDDFTSLTLSPSVDASETGHWHGFVKNGEIT